MYLLFMLFVSIVKTTYASYVEEVPSKKSSRRVIVHLEQSAIDYATLKQIEELSKDYNETIKHHKITLINSLETQFPGLYSKFLIQLDIEQERHKEYNDNDISTENHPRDCYDKWHALCMFAEDEIKIANIRTWIDQTKRKKRSSKKLRSRSRPMLHKHA